MVKLQSHRLQGMAVRAIICVTALLLVCLDVKVTGMHRCTKYQLEHCDANHGINITKNEHHYYLKIIFNNQCTYMSEVLDSIEWIDCNHICQDCEDLKGQG